MYPADYNQNDRSQQQCQRRGTYNCGLVSLAQRAPWDIPGTVRGPPRMGRLTLGRRLQAQLGTSVPFNFSHGRLYQFLTPSVSFHTTQLYLQPDVEKYFRSTHVEYLEWGLNWSTQVQQSVQQIFPHQAPSRSRRAMTEPPSTTPGPGKCLSRVQSTCRGFGIPTASC